MIKKVQIYEADLTRYLKMQIIADRIAEYMTVDSKEEDDFQEQCFNKGLSEEKPGSNDLNVYTLDSRHEGHIFFEIQLYKHLSGYDIAPYCFATEYLKELGL